MSTVHAWFSAGFALLEGSSIFRKPDGSVVNVTRTSPAREALRGYRYEETYVGEVVSPDEGGCIRAKQRVRGISGA
jgi:hypothetical protein